MHTFTQYPLWVRVATPLIIVALFGAVIHNSRADEEIVEKHTVEKQQLFNPEEVRSFGFPVSGIVESSDSVTVRALAGGIVREKFVGEGSVVYEGDVLLAEEVPLLAERMALQDAQNGLSTLMQDASVIGRTAEKDSAFVQHDAASTSVALSSENIQAQVEGATALLATQTYGSVTSLVSVLDFIDANKSRFPGKDLMTFRETIDQLYGSNRTYLSGPIQYSFKSNDDILGFLDTLTENSMYPDTATLILIAELVDAELDATKHVLVSGEKQFLDNNIVAHDSELYTAYLTYRGSVIEAQANLRTMISSARSARAGGNLGILGTNTENTLRTIGYSTASLMADNAVSMASQTDVVVNAGMSVLRGEESLGQPKAPFDGVVDDVFVKVGDFVSPGTPLMTLVGSDAKELKVSVPQSMLPYLKEGAEFIVDGSVVGHVARFSRTAMGGNITVIIELSDGDYIPGITLHGKIECELSEGGAFALPRSYVYFDNEGAFVRTESNKAVRVVILHDTGKSFVVRPAEQITEKIIKAIGIVL